MNIVWIANRNTMTTTTRVKKNWNELHATFIAGEPVMSNAVNDAWWERAYEDHYEDLKADG